MPEPEKALSFRLPEGGVEEVYLVRLPDGRLVARTAGELVSLPAELRASAEIVTTEPEE